MYDNTDFDAVPIMNKRQEIAQGPCEPQPAVFSKLIQTPQVTLSRSMKETVDIQIKFRRYPNKIPSCFTD